MENKAIASIPSIIYDKFNLFYNGGAGCGKTTCVLEASYNLHSKNRVLYLNPSRAAMLFAKEKFLHRNSGIPDIRFSTINGWISRCFNKLITFDSDLSLLKNCTPCVNWIPNVIILDDFHLCTQLQISMVRHIINILECRVQFLLLGDFEPCTKVNELEWTDCCSSRGWVQVHSRFSMRCSSAICNFINANTERKLHTAQPTFHKNCDVISVDLADSENLFLKVKSFLSSDCALLFPSEFQKIRRYCMNFINAAISSNPKLKFHTRIFGETTFNYESLQKKIWLWPVTQFEGIEREVVILLAPPNVSSETLYKACSRAKTKFVWFRHISKLGNVSKTMSVSHVSNIFRVQDVKWSTIIDPIVRDDICMVARFDSHTEDLSFIYGNAIMLCLEYFFTSELKSTCSFVHPIFIDKACQAKNLLKKNGIHSNIDDDASAEQSVAHVRYALSTYGHHEVESRVFSTKYFFNRISPRYYAEAVNIVRELSHSFCARESDEQDANEHITKLFKVSVCVTAFYEHQGILQQIDSFDWIRLDLIYQAIKTISSVLSETFLCDLSTAIFEKPLVYGMLNGKCDIYFQGLVCEIKFTNALTESHKVQTLIYACIACIQTQRPHTAVLFNMRNFEVLSFDVQIDHAYEILGKAMSMLSQSTVTDGKAKEEVSI